MYCSWHLPEFPGAFIFLIQESRVYHMHAPVGTLEDQHLAWTRLLGPLDALLANLEWREQREHQDLLE